MNYKSSKKTDEYFWSEDFEDFRKRDAEKYDVGVMRYPFNLELYDQLVLPLLDDVLKQIPKGKILDAGGGTGKWALYFAQKGFDVTLIDISEAMLAVARDRMKFNNVSSNLVIINGTICDIPLDDYSFDFIFCERNPISHCGKSANAAKAVGELTRVLRPGGFFWGCVLNRLRKVSQMVMELDFERAHNLMETGDLPRSRTEYSHYFLLNEWVELLTKHGLENIEVYPATALAEYIPSAWLLGSEPLKKLLELERQMRQYPEATSYGVRFHTLARKQKKEGMAL